MARSRALVLGGGGLTGMAWEAGVLQGLAAAGVDVGRWDRIVGTSAGAFVGAHVAAGNLASLYESQATRSLDAEVRVLAGRFGGVVLVLGRRRRLTWLPGAWVGGRAMRAIATQRIRGRRSARQLAAPAWPAAAPPDARAARLGALARSAKTPSVERFRSIVAALLEPVATWPLGLVVATVDAADGSLVCLDQQSGVSLVDAVAASAALPVLFPSVSLRGRWYIDGGMRSDTNIALAGGVEEVIAIVPIDHGGLAAEAEPLRQQGTVVSLVTPDAASRAALGVDLEMLDPIRRADAARAGYEQGLAVGRSLVAVA